MAGRRLLFVADSLQTGGAERALLGLAALLIARDDEVTIACSIGGALAVEAEQIGAEVEVLGSRLVKRRIDLRFAASLHQLIRRRQFDGIHTHMYASSMAAVLATLGGGPPVVMHEHSEAGWRGRLARAAARLAYHRAAAIIAVSESIRDRLIGTDHVEPAKVRVISNCLPQLPPRGAGEPLTGDDRPVVGVVARLQPEKGVAVFLRAAARIVDLFPTAAFVVVGDGPQRPALEDIAARLAIPVRFLGFRPDGPALIGQLDLLVVPSFSEGTPLVILEAMDAGVPVVATEVGGIPTQVTDDVDALLVPAGDAQALATACERILGDPGLAERLAACARRRVAQSADGSAMLRSVDAVYSDVLTAEQPAVLSWPVHRTVP
jgi:glycosyltransferase involved in cell wall biosynthesis